MRRVTIPKTIVIGVPILALGSYLAIDRILYYRATPPKEVSDISSCLAWLKTPLRAYRIQSGDSVYFEILGPAGRALSSGPAGYAFDAKGKFIGWSMDIGDSYTPPEIFVLRTNWTQISVEDLKTVPR